ANLCYVADCEGPRVEEDMFPGLHLREELLDEDGHGSSVGRSFDEQNQPSWRGHGSGSLGQGSLEPRLIDSQELLGFQVMLAQGLQLFRCDWANPGREVVHLDNTDLLGGKVVQELRAVGGQENLAVSLVRVSLVLFGEDDEAGWVDSL